MGKYEHAKYLKKTKVRKAWSRASCDKPINPGEEYYRETIAPINPGPGTEFFSY